MASIKKRPNGAWRARYRDHEGKEHAQHFARKVDAQRWLDEVTTSIVTGSTWTQERGASPSRTSTRTGRSARSGSRPQSWP